MIILPNGKICMNEQEAIQWLLDNYPIPFQCSANYAADTEIGLGTIVNPTPAKVKVGSIIFFADSKVSTVVGLTANGFICSDKYNDLVDDIVYVSNVQLNASGHLIVTLSNATTIDAGLIKQISSFSIDSSQHLIASYNDGTSTDLGAIFSGNITISGNLTVTGGISGNAITGNSIIENMVGYNFTKYALTTPIEVQYAYAGIVKTGNKLTLAIAGTMIRKDTVSDAFVIARFGIPTAIGQKLFPFTGSTISYKKLFLAPNSYSGIELFVRVLDYADSILEISVSATGANDMSLNTNYYFRFEETYLLSDNLAV